MNAQQLTETVHHALENAFFTIGKYVFRQIQGALIGSPLSAALCLLHVARIERKYLRDARQCQVAEIPRNTWMSTRYVDNLITVWTHRLPTYLQRPDMYGATVLLEFEPGLDFLGTQLAIDDNGTLQLDFQVNGFDELTTGRADQPTEIIENSWRYRSRHAAASQRMQMVGYTSRLTSAARLAHPVTRARQAIAKIACIMLAYNFDHGLVLNELRRQAKRHKNVYSDQYLSYLETCFSAPSLGERLSRLCRLADD